MGCVRVKGLINILSFWQMFLMPLSGHYMVKRVDSTQAGIFVSHPSSMASWFRFGELSKTDSILISFS